MRIPTAVYRLQLTPDFGFRHVADIVAYLEALGISDIYASPIFKARHGSAHGYDVVAPGQLNPELGSEAQWRELTEKRRKLNLGWLQDIVPNHMAFSGENPHITELLETGPQKRMADFFDILWNHPRPEFNGRVSAPFLGDSLELCLGAHQISLKYDAAGLFIAYFEHRFALALPTYSEVFGDPTVEKIDAPPHPQVVQWLETIQAIAQWRRSQSLALEDLKARLWSAFESSEPVRHFVSRCLQAHNAPSERRRLARLLQKQFFHLNHWQQAARAINYRRFFSINDLIALRQEKRWVFDRTHALIVRFIQANIFTGLRVDHIDGLLMPGLYLERLREVCGDTYLVVEKILEAEETAPRGWPVQGTTGYDFAAHIDRLFTFPKGKAALDQIYADFRGEPSDYETIVHQCKIEVLETHFSGDFENLTQQLGALPEFKDNSSVTLKEALKQTLINLPVYRTYLSDGSRPVEDKRILNRAIAAAAKQRPDLLDTLQALERFMGAPAEDERCRDNADLIDDPRHRAMGAFEQLGVVITAKGVEDTALYRFHRLTALNEVGGAPQKFSESRSEFHHFIKNRLLSSPHALNTLTTHDSKRSSDVRARILTLAEIAPEWAERVKAWRALNRMPVLSSKPDGTIDPDTEYLLYQTLVGTWPDASHDFDAYIRRIEAYMIKAVREAKQFTDWTAPDSAYEEGVKGFVRRILDRRCSEKFMADLSGFASKAAELGKISILARTLILLTAPGIPDIYQGTELMDDSLVDPDNRRRVDFEKRRNRLERLQQMAADAGADVAVRLTAVGDDDLLKLWLIHVALRYRRQAADLFAHGEYLPVDFSGPWDRHAVGFARRRRNQWCLIVVPRFWGQLAGTDAAPRQPNLWENTILTLPPGAPQSWRNLLTEKFLEAEHGRFPLQTLLADFPVALLVAETLENG